MTEEEIRSVAAQLRKPEGEWAKVVAERMNEGNQLMNRHAISVLHAQKGDRILEIGMGNGFFVKDILDRSETISYIGCDHSAEMVREATELNAHFVKPGRATFHTCDAGSLPLENESVNKILTINTLYFWENPVKVLNEFKRVLKPNGELILAIRPKETLLKYPMSKYGFNIYESTELIQLLTSADFQLHAMIDRIEHAKDFLEHQIPDAFTIMHAFQSLKPKAKRVFLSSEIDALEKRFLDLTLPESEWTHEAHLVLAIRYVCRYDSKEALDLAREHISRYNESLGNVNSDSDGYHESITAAWLILAKQFCNQNPDLTETQRINSFIGSLHTQRNFLSRFYSDELLFSAQARRNQCSPDLRALTFEFNP